jgi:16S rRNA (cytosine967-C5)-methyltransferase
MRTEATPEQGARSQPGPATPRAAAAALLEAVLSDQRMLSEAAEDPAGPLVGLSGPERARAQRLASTALRHLSRVDAVLKPFLRKRPPPAVHAALRIATTELCALDGDAHGVVDSTVGTLRRQPRMSRHAGLANAVLRRVAEVGPAQWADLPAQRLPGWLRGRLLSAHGAAVVAAIEAVQAQVPPLDLTPRDPAQAWDLAAALGAELLPTGSLRLRAPGQVTTLPGFEAGNWWVQDAAAALAARILDAQPGERVLDLCAAPGGKTLQLAAAGAEVTALDISERRVLRLAENLSRTGLRAETVVADALEWAGGPFDAVLLDAPCSATGTIRRHPELPFLRQRDDLPALTALQAALLDRAAGWLRPGGRLVYATCSLLQAEGEDQITALLARDGRLVPAPDLLDRAFVAPDWRSGPGLRLRPDHWSAQGGMDGFFIAALRRAA